MNRALRRRHRLIFTTLAVGMPVGLALAFSSRVPPATMAALPEAMAEPMLTGSPERVLDWDGLPLRAELFVDAVRIVPLEPLRLPNPLLYRSKSYPVGDRLPADARLLGPLSDAAPQVFPLDVPVESGFVILMSPITGRVHGSVSLEAAR